MVPVISPRLVVQLEPPPRPAASVRHGGSGSRTDSRGQRTRGANGAAVRLQRPEPLGDVRDPLRFGQRIGVELHLHEGVGEAAEALGLVRLAVARDRQHRVAAIGRNGIRRKVGDPQRTFARRDAANLLETGAAAAGSMRSRRSSQSADHEFLQAVHRIPLHWIEHIHLVLQGFRGSLGGGDHCQCRPTEPHPAVLTSGITTPADMLIARVGSGLNSV